MKNLFICLVACAVWLFSMESYACNSDCKQCPDGFSYTVKCCKNSNSDDCIFLRNEIEECGAGRWKAYPNSLPIIPLECCTSSTENHCLSIAHNKDACGTGKMEEYPYSPFRKCCKDIEGKDCITIRAKARLCGWDQLKDYPKGRPDCCNSDLTECIGHINVCPFCM